MPISIILTQGTTQIRQVLALFDIRHFEFQNGRQEIWYMIRMTLNMSDLGFIDNLYYHVNNYNEPQYVN